MKCPVCSRDMAPTLSICPSCGTMKNDTVREDLQTKITSGSLCRPAVAVSPEPKPMVTKAEPVIQAPMPEIPRHPAPMLGRGPTKDLSSAKTSPTLVGFQNKMTAVPEWRLQMQNAARQRMGMSADAVPAVAAAPGLRTGVATAVRAQPAAAKVILPENADPRLAKAVGRINASRNSFATPMAPTKPSPMPAQKNFPFNVVVPSAAPAAHSAKPVLEPPPKPVLVPTVRVKLDTNKLPKINEVLAREIETVEPIDALVVDQPSKPFEFEPIKRIVISADHSAETDETEQEFEAEQIDDLAPFAMRFNAGLFDLIIGIVVSMVVLSPFALTGGSWASVSGAFTFVATLGIVMFLYLTACVAFVGKTLGMRLFSLEVVDAEENAYPTLHQAAVSSSLYLFSLLLGGAGFLTIFFNEEKRAVHDLLSGTIIVREF